MPDEKITDVAVYESHDLVMSRTPDIILAEAKLAAVALKDVLDKKPKKVVFNNEQYLEYEDLSLLGRFYGITAKCIGCHETTMGGHDGFEAVAQAIRADGAVISQAEAVCMRDEPNWASKPIYQLKSMAQTRACAKVLRNVLSWVVVLAGYRPTPAEEIEGVAGAKTVTGGGTSESRKPSEGMAKLIHVLLGKLNIKDSDAKHKHCTSILARAKPITTLDYDHKDYDITWDEAKSLIDMLQVAIGKKQEG